MSGVVYRWVCGRHVNIHVNLHWVSFGMLTFMGICIRSALGLRTSLVILSVGLSTGLMMNDASSSSRKVSSWDHVAKRIFRCG